MTHHGSDYYMSAKVISVRTNGYGNAERAEFERLLSPLGATNIMTTGHEYDDAFCCLGLDTGTGNNGGC